MFLTQRVRQGRESDYQRWQDRLTALARDFPGFEGQEIYPPGDSAQHEWTVTYSFTQADQLTTWLNSPERQGMLDQGRSFFEGPETQEVLVGEPPVQKGVTVVVSHHIAPGRERDYLHWQHKLEKVQEKFPGYMGLERFRPVPGIEENWVVVFRFDTREHLENWLGSEARRKLLEEGADAVGSYEVRRVGSAFSGWFGTEGDTGKVAVPNWKQAMAVFLAIYPVVVLLSRTVNNALLAAGLPVYAMLFVSNIVSVALLTWAVMPLVNRLLRFWLAPAPTAGRGTDVLGTVVVAVGCLVFLALAPLAWRY
ncbi:antibiotic biosynthesis monooxygenase [Streptomyces sp. NPDC004542]|uniref:antibiotic biosynthesis monooxygenase n=1 Tax=Streptomyces sp. NPDC004542 TaxID=3154281 RepID=UPI0033A2D9FB